MDEITFAIDKTTNLTGDNLLIDDSGLSLSFDLNSFFAGNFIPPPPRPIFLDDGVTSDGLTTCDLCTWAWQNDKIQIPDHVIETPAELSWMLTLVIVSLISALIGAVVMVIALHCRKNKSSGQENEPPNLESPNRPPMDLPEDKAPNLIRSNFPSNNSVWSWLSRRSAMTASQLDNPQSSPAENHYTHMEDNYNGEALYAELDRESTLNREGGGSAYQNSAYADPDAPTSSAPSSAYYSDLSITGPDRVYEVVGMATVPVWDTANDAKRQSLSRLAAISENTTVPSDYV